MLTVYLIRHARSAANAVRCWTGQRDIGLSPEGIAEQRALCGKYSYPDAEFYFSSPLMRCTQSFEIIYGARPCFMAASLMECSLGVLEGKKYTSLDDDPAYTAWLAHPEVPLEHGESFSGFTERVCAGFAELLAQLQKKRCRSAAGVMHGNVMRALLHRFANASIPHGGWPIPNGGLYTLEFSDAMRCTKVSAEPAFLFGK